LNRTALALGIAAPGAAVAWLLLGTVATLPPGTGAGDWSGDFRSLYLPNAEYLGARLAAGEIPLWNPHQGAGGPFLAAVQAAVLYPPNALHALVPVQTAFVALAAAHVALAVVLAGGLARSLGANAWGAALAGLLYGTSVQVVGAVWTPPVQYAAAWAPGAWWALDRVLRAPGARSAAALAATVAALAVCGWPYTLAIVGTCGALYAAFGVAAGVRRARRVPWPVLGAGLLGAVAGGLLAAPQLLPALELVGRSPRAIGTLVGDQTVFVDAPHQPAVFLRTLVRRGYNDAVPGLLSLGLALAALVLPGAGRIRLWALAVPAALFVMGSFPRHFPVYDGLRALPILGDFRFPFRYRIALTLLLAVGAGLGATRVCEALRGRPRAAATAGAVLLVLAAGTAAIPILRGVPGFARHVPPPRSVSEELRELGAEPSDAPFLRVYWEGRAEKLRAPEGHWVVHDMEPLSLARTAQLLTFFETGRPRTELERGGARGDRIAVPYYGIQELPGDGDRARLLDLLSVGTLVVEFPPGWALRRYTPLSPPGQDPVVLANPHARPRAYRVPWALYEGRTFEATLRKLLTDRFDPRVHALVPKRPALLRWPPGAEPPADLGEVSIERYEPERVVLATRGPQPGLVVLTDAWYPGWEARLDGAPVPLHHANVAFRGVVVPAGEHTVEMRYRPASFRRGAALAGVGAAALLAAWVVGARRELA